MKFAELVALFNSSMDTGLDLRLPQSVRRNNVSSMNGSALASALTAGSWTFAGNLIGAQTPDWRVAEKPIFCSPFT